MFQGTFWNFFETWLLTSVRTPNVPWRDNCPWGVKQVKKVRNYIKHNFKCTQACLLGAAWKVQWEESNVWKDGIWAKRLEDETQRFGEESESSYGNDISQNNET